MWKPYSRPHVLGFLAFSLLIPRPAQSASADEAGAGPELSGATAAVARAATPSAAALQIYRAHCLLCHDVDGRGELGRDGAPAIPDFTDARWQASRSEAELSRSILEGKGKVMPRMKSKLGSVDVKLMVALVRAFQDGKLVVEEEPGPAPAAEKPATAAGSVGQPGAPASRPLSQNQGATPEGGRLFQKSCAMCHGRDGKGTDARESLRSIPDFTVRDWHQKRSNAQLMVSILDGKGTGMPAFRDKIPRERAREIVAHIRSFAPGATSEVASSSNEFEAQFNKLLKEFDDIARQLRDLGAAKPAPAPAAEVPKK
jgi:mono/diheme cytochrome c family protein